MNSPTGVFEYEEIEDGFDLLDDDELQLEEELNGPITERAPPANENEHIHSQEYLEFWGDPCWQEEE
jgi:hypothetical protein